MAKLAFTAGRVAGFTCQADKAQQFLWDSTAPGLGLRVTPAGKPAYVFQGLYQGKTLRLTIGDPDAWSIPRARDKARELQRQIDDGRDPRALKAQAIAAHAAQRSADAALAATLGLVWTQYLEARCAKWSASHHADHLRYAQAGGQKKKRGQGDTAPGPLFALMACRLQDLSPERLRQWAEHEAAVRPTVARNAARLLRACLAWCAEHPQHAASVPAVNPAGTRAVREALGKPGVKRDALQREQLPGWFAAVRGLRNPTVAAYLQTVLLTGARPGEVLAMRWDDLNARWKGLTIRDKVEGERVIPLTPWVANLLAALPRRGPFVFASPVVQGAHLSEPNHAHDRACQVAGIDGLTLHGLRRSFKSLTEWLDIPAGVVAQLMGHKPSATAERHYTVRPLDLLRVHHERIEAWILAQAGVQFDAAAPATGGLRQVA